MNIKGISFPCIGHIFAKPLPDSDDWLLEIHPPTPGPLMGHEPAWAVELTVSTSEAERVDRLAPHLVTGVRPSTNKGHYIFQTKRSRLQPH